MKSINSVSELEQAKRDEVRELAARAGAVDEVRHEKVSALRKSIAEGSYKVSAEALAERLMNSMMR